MGKAGDALPARHSHYIPQEVVVDSHWRGADGHNRHPRPDSGLTVTRADPDSSGYAARGCGPGTGVQGSRQGVTEVIGALLERPDELMLELGAGGEQLVARIRAMLSALILLFPLANAIGGGSVTETLIGLAAAVFVNVMAQVWLALARRRRRHSWLPYATGTYDVTTTTGVLVLLALGERAAGTNSMVVWVFYLIAIAMTTLRNDGRLTLYVCALAALQYAVFVWVVFASASTPEQLVSVDYGTATVGNQINRVVLILLMGLLTTAVVYRMQRLVELSGKDGLTGLPNRMWLLQQMPQILDRQRRDGGTLSLGLLDLDRFRLVNEDIGHIGGDRAIRHVASLLEESLEEHEHLVRIGGEEFVMLLCSPIGSAWERIERIRRTLAERPYQPRGNADPLQLRISAGLASWPQDGDELSVLLGNADGRLQQAKREGGNRVVARNG